MRRPGCNHQSHLSLRSPPPQKDMSSDSRQTPAGVLATNLCRCEGVPWSSAPASRKQRGHIKWVLKMGCWVRPFPSGHKVDGSEGLRPPRVAQLCSSTSGSSEVVTCLHRFNVRDQGSRQEDAKYLKTKPQRQLLSASGPKGQGGARQAHRHPPCLPTGAEDAESSNQAHGKMRPTHS